MKLKDVKYGMFNNIFVTLPFYKIGFTKNREAKFSDLFFSFI